MARCLNLVERKLQRKFLFINVNQFACRSWACPHRGKSFLRVGQSGSELKQGAPTASAHHQSCKAVRSHTVHEEGEKGFASLSGLPSGACTAICRHHSQSKGKGLQAHFFCNCLFVLDDILQEHGTPVCPPLWLKRPKKSRETQAVSRCLQPANPAELAVQVLVLCLYRSA